MGRGDNNKIRAASHEARILDILASEPMTLRQLADKLGLSLDSLYIYRNRLSSAPKRIYVSGYSDTGARPAPLYAAGDLPDVEYVPARKPKLAEDRKTKQRNRLLELLKNDGEQTAEQAGIRLSLSTSRARFYINELRTSSLKQAYIKRWQHPGKRGDLAPVYALGNRPDAPKPRTTRAQRYKQEKSDQDKYDHILDQRRTRYALKRASSKPRSWAYALGL